MNRKQRESNRRNASDLAAIARAKAMEAHTCENCGEPGGHWVQTMPQSLQAIMDGTPDQGFWTCPMYYGEDGRRKPEHIDPTMSGGLGAFVIAMHEFGLMGKPAPSSARMPLDGASGQDETKDQK